MTQFFDAADIFFGVRLRLATTVLVAAVATLSGATVAAAAKRPKHHAPTGPTAKQIRAAVTKAKHSPDLWATVNQCTSAPTVPPGDVVGIRGQMPSLGFATTMLMKISVDYWNYTDSMFEPAKDSMTISPKKGAPGARQGGVSFPLTPPSPPGSFTYLVRGTITFEWKLGTKVIASLVRNTGHGYANVGFATPAGYSAGTCTLT